MCLTFSGHDFPPVRENTLTNAPLNVSTPTSLGDSKDNPIKESSSLESSTEKPKSVTLADEALMLKCSICG